MGHVVVVPFFGLPSFWRSWMYYLTPFRYLMEGLLSVSVHGLQVQCDDTEFAKFPAPPGQTCQSYTEGFIRQAGGYVENGSDGLCHFCQYATGDEFVSRAFFIFCGDTHHPLWTRFFLTLSDVGRRIQCLLLEYLVRLRCLLGLLCLQFPARVLLFVAVS